MISAGITSALKIIGVLCGVALVFYALLTPAPSDHEDESEGGDA